MIGAVDWESLNVAGAFVVGATLATIATIRVVRAVSDMLREERHKERLSTKRDQQQDHDQHGDD